MHMRITLFVLNLFMVPVHGPGQQESSTFKVRLYGGSNYYITRCLIGPAFVAKGALQPPVTEIAS